MALIHSYFVDIFVHGKLLHSSASRTHVTIYDVKKCQQNTRESMPNCLRKNKDNERIKICVSAFSEIPKY